MAKYYTVKKQGDRGVVVESQNPIAKQIFFGWGSGSDPIDAQFYGNEVPGAWGPGHELRYRWKLTSGAVYRMIDNIRNHIDDQNYYAKSEVKAARELLGKLEDASKGWG
jgi:hypothetical protein